MKAKLSAMSVCYRSELVRDGSVVVRALGVLVSFPIWALASARKCGSKRSPRRVVDRGSRFSRAQRSSLVDVLVLGRPLVSLNAFDFFASHTVVGCLR